MFTLSALAAGDLMAVAMSVLAKGFVLYVFLVFSGFDAALTTNERLLERFAGSSHQKTPTSRD